MNGNIYLDNAATSFPKPPQVAAAMTDYIQNVGCNVNRGGYAGAWSAEEVVLETRERLCRLFGFPNARNVIFTQSVTASLNFLLKGLLRRGDHVLTSAVEHNAVIRPLAQLKESGVSFDRVPCSPEGALRPESVESMLQPETRLVVLTHASNVGGALLPVAAVGRICRGRGVFFIVDSAQTAGCIPINMEEMCIDGLAFTGHKGLMGPQGTGGFIATDALAAELTPLICGGTGSYSHLDTMPERLPDRFEAGTMNLPGLYGLHAAAGFVSEVGLPAISRHEAELAERFTAPLRGAEGLRLVGPAKTEQKTGVVSLDFLKCDNAEISSRLEKEYGILTRCGLHCAPDAHRTLGTFPKGTVRFSFGWYNTPEEADIASGAVLRLL